PTRRTTPSLPDALPICEQNERASQQHRRGPSRERHEARGIGEEGKHRGRYQSRFEGKGNAVIRPVASAPQQRRSGPAPPPPTRIDRKSTRLNSSHVKIS